MTYDSCNSGFDNPSEQWSWSGMSEHGQEYICYCELRMVNGHWSTNIKYDLNIVRLFGFVVYANFIYLFILFVKSNHQHDEGERRDEKIYERVRQI